MIEYEGIVYELKFNLKRIDIIENRIGKPIMACLQSGFMSLSELTICLVYGMKKEGADAFTDPKKAKAVIDELLSQEGAYYKLTDELVDALQRDCPFFFPAD